MINGIRIKVCGITSLVDADLADKCGADYLGFILYPKSSRFVPLSLFSAILHRLPPRKKVAVSVTPTPEELAEFAAAGFDFFQVHFPHETSIEKVAAWARVVGPQRLWLAPKLPPGAAFDERWLEHAKTVLWDTFHAAGFGGSGQTGDWGRFAELRATYPDTTWILAGGLNPDNIANALAASGTQLVDVNSGVEQAPGVKSEAKLKRFLVAVHLATKQNNPAY